MYGLGEVLPRFENKVELDPRMTDTHGLPVLRFSYRYGDNEKRMCKDMTASMEEIFKASGLEITKSQSEPLVEGSSVHEVGTARMGTDPKTSVLNPFCQSHDVKNLYVVDGASFVSAACQNPTWTIMALAWRACDHLAEELKRGHL
jgi:choline dehydrogenase-like flavoprotein